MAEGPSLLPQDTSEAAVIPLYFRSPCLVLFTLLWVLLPVVAQADEPLQEGFTITAGSGSHDRHRLESSLDIKVIPLPGGGRLNGTHLMVGVGSDYGFESFDLDRGRIQLLRWSHLRTLGVYRERDQGIPLGLELGGVSIPMAFVGKKESRNWIIGHLGLDGGFAWYRQDFDAAEDGMGANVDVTFRLDQQVDIFDRLSLRSWQQAGYRLVVGQFGGRSGLEVQNQFVVSGALGLYLDITRQPLFREIPRTNPATGEVTYRRSVNQGKRWRWMIARASGHWHPVGDHTGLPHLLYVATGFERSF